MKVYLVIAQGMSVFNGAEYGIAISDKSPHEVLESIAKAKPFFGKITIDNWMYGDNCDYGTSGTCMAKSDIDGSVKEVRIVVDSSVKTMTM